ncbi:MAG: NADH-quinone oxidoreductase subunit N [Phycisphaeraceae bacterium]|nr:MAG: NADH-quinone oxidoreductase subunit N [Phycisphaeraceae bacterium]
MIERLAFLWPEIALFITTCVVMVVGLSRSTGVRRLSALITAVGLAAALVLAVATTPKAGQFAPADGQTLFPDLPVFAKTLFAAVGLLLLPLLVGTVDRDDEREIAAGRRAFDPLRSNRAEFYAFYLFSLTGLMLCASASDLVWLFLALELTSLPTYVMVAISSRRHRAQEAAVKYFFLGALGAACFLMGFAFIYGGTGTTRLNVIADVFAASGINPIALAGLVLAVVGLAFKIAAVPMHFYTPDVYQGASPSVAGMLAFVPKAAGFVSLILVLGTVGWTHGPGGESGHSLPESLRVILWVMAALTMTVGNVLALLQSSVRRVLAYSSVAHSGYMLVALVAGPGDGSAASNGLAAVLFYLLAYGVMNLGAFAVLASLVRRNPKDGSADEIDSFDDLRGLCATRPFHGWTLVVCALSLLGFPPLLGFFAKVPLFTSGIAAGEYTLVVILGLNSAIAAFYYLRLVQMPLLEKPDPTTPVPEPVGVPSRTAAGLLSAAGAVVLIAVAGSLFDQAHRASRDPRTVAPARDAAGEPPAAPPIAARPE